MKKARPTAEDDEEQEVDLDDDRTLDAIEQHLLDLHTQGNPQNLDQEIAAGAGQDPPEQLPDAMP
eukprot:2415221-Amphidinium_carterae.1